MDIKALADELTHICGLDKLDDEPCGRCERCRAARILRDVVPQMGEQVNGAICNLDLIIQGRDFNGSMLDSIDNTRLIKQSRDLLQAALDARLDDGKAEVL